MNGAQAGRARPAREPSTEDRRALGEVRTKLSIQDTFKITERQGSKVPVGDIAAKRWKALAGRKAKKAWVDGREAEFATIMAAHVEKHAHVPTDAKTRDIVPDSAVEAAIAESARIANYQRRITSIVQEAAHG